MLYIISPWLIYFITGSLYLLTPHFAHPPQTPPLATTDLFLSMSLILFTYLFVLDSTYNWGHTVFVFVWFISLSIMPSTSIHVVSNGEISFFFMGEWYFITHTRTHTHTHTPHFLYPFTHWWTLRLFPYLGYCK